MTAGAKGRERFYDAYTYIFTAIYFLAMAGLTSYALREVRGSYLAFTLEDAQALPFFCGAVLIVAAGFVWLLHTLGPIAHSPSELFWRYSGPALPTGNPWRRLETWLVLCAWATLSVLLATVFAPLSTLWLVGAATSTILFGAILIQGCATAQLLARPQPLLVWACTCLLTGLALVFTATLGLPLPAGIHPTTLALGALALMALLGALGSLTLNLLARHTRLEWSSAVSAYARSLTLLHALRNIGGTDGYRYFGSHNTRIRSTITSSSPATLSLAALADSLLPLTLITLTSLPFAIFFGVGYGPIGPAAVTSIGALATASFYRWLAREWSTHRPLRQWTGAPYLPTLLGFTLGPALATGTYILLMALIFQLTPWALAAGLLFGAAIALGEVNPPTHYNYDLTFTSIEGLSVPIEPVIGLLKTLLLIGGMIFLLTFGNYLTLLGPALFFLNRAINHAAQKL